METGIFPIRMQQFQQHYPGSNGLLTSILVRVLSMYKLTHVDTRCVYFVLQQLPALESLKNFQHAGKLLLLF
jgi:hypothetical protein